MRLFITSKNKYLSNDMNIFGTCSIPLSSFSSLKSVCIIFKCSFMHAYDLVLAARLHEFYVHLAWVMLVLMQIYL